MFDETDNIGSPAVGFQYIIEATDDYQVRIVDDIIVCNGTFNVTLPPSDIARKQVTVISTNGTITVLGDVPIESSNILTTGAAENFVLAFAQWFHL